MKISISSNDILLQVYARAALDATVRDAYDTMITVDRREALQKLMTGVAAELFLHMMPVMKWSNVDSLEFDVVADTLIEYEFRDNTVEMPVVLRLLIEQAIVTRLLGEIYGYSDCDRAAEFMSEFHVFVARITEVVTAPVSGLRVAAYPDWY